MKKFVHQIQIGQKVIGQVEEIQITGHLIVAFNGDLIRVMNNSEKSFKSGDQLDLYVWSVKPLEFRLSKPEPKRFERTI